MSRLKAFLGLISNIFRKPVTVKESFGFLPDTFRWLPRRDAEKCTGCGACFERCSSGATSITDTGTDRLVSIDGYDCIFCGRCVDVCPEKALQSNQEALSEEEKKKREELLKKIGKKCDVCVQCLRCLDEDSNAVQKYISQISLNKYQKEGKPTTDTHLTLQKCSVCGQVMPASEKYLQVIRERALKNLKPETAAIVEQDMKYYLTACIDCRRKYSLEWKTHPRKFI